MRTAKAEYSQKFKDVKVIPIDMVKLNAEIDKSIKAEVAKAIGSKLVKPVEEGQEFFVHGHIAIIVGTNIITDREAIHTPLDSDTEEYELEIYSKIVTDDGKSTSYSMMPLYTNNTNIAKLLKDYAQPETSLEEFMCSRFAYNPRIECNMNILAKSIKQVKVN